LRVSAECPGLQRLAGAFFSIFTTILVFLDYRYGGTKQTSEQVQILATDTCFGTIDA
jgi:hypothetical protein